MPRPLVVVTLLTDETAPGVGRRRTFRLVGDPEPGSGWAAREGREPWCEVAIYDDGPWLAVYGGEVWPTAWPSLFDPVRTMTYVAGAIKVTPAGLAALDGATR